MEIKCSCVCTLLLLLLLLGPGLSSGRMHGKKMGSEVVYDIDYRGPETHTYHPPPNRAGPRIPHRAADSARHKAKRNVRRNVSRKMINYKS